MTHVPRHGMPVSVINGFIGPTKSPKKRTPPHHGVNDYIKTHSLHCASKVYADIPCSESCMLLI